MGGGTKCADENKNYSYCEVMNKVMLNTTYYPMSSYRSSYSRFNNLHFISCTIFKV